MNQSMFSEKNAAFRNGPAPFVKLSRNDYMARQTRRYSQPATRPAPQASSQTSGLTDRAINQGIALLVNLAQQRKDKRARYSSTTAEEPHLDPDSSSQIYDAFLNNRGPDGILTMTNFSPDEFNVLWADIRQLLLKSWNTGSGRKSEVSGRDLLLMSLVSLKHCGTWDVVAAIFNHKVSTFEKRVMTFLNAFHPFLMRNYVNALVDKWTMQHLVSSNAEKKLYFSGKHYLYGHKVEVSVLPNGFAINCSKHYKGSVSDKTIFDENLDFHVANLSKGVDEMYLDDPTVADDVREWAVIADKGYQGIQHAVRAVLPTKKRTGEMLSVAEERQNDCIATDRVIVENLFGRVKTLWGVCPEKYPLTNLHVRFHPLRAEDGKMLKNKKNAARKYRVKRKARLAMVLVAEGGLVADAADSGTDFGSNIDDESQVFL
ncbi:Aste57867_16100 [Aphanomyces stellatus]|uniref:Aste57867_16100 protein n=1 Tax=Aphanomyces stellatus TaxID=120398 RepID=A0A485L5N4_9STRA|nr:hypothetical protein As57867_016044 [Aphanomyces stellatus]VFT92883.1 Aste57867_16100 [Aphanomyces stellatus]